ncbi:hypothetical protein EDB83DRAFT_2316360 [Lactarius deliciosus]|nr:hypothetical protein EDB83DRAFT_2316360 [Lactarius deliciosus]
MIPTSPPVAVAIQHSTGRRTSLDVPDVPLLPSPSLVLFPTESHSSMLAPTAPNPSHPRLSSAPDIDASAEGEGSANVTLKERTAHDSPLTIQENTIAAPDLPPQSPSPLGSVSTSIIWPVRYRVTHPFGSVSILCWYRDITVIVLLPYTDVRKIWGNLEQSRACEDMLRPNHCGRDEWGVEDGCKSVRGVTTDETREEDAVSSTNKGTHEVAHATGLEFLGMGQSAWARWDSARISLECNMTRAPVPMPGSMRGAGAHAREWGAGPQVMYRQEGGATRRDKDKSYEAMGVGASDGLRTGLLIALEVRCWKGVRGQFFKLNATVTRGKTLLHGSGAGPD